MCESKDKHSSFEGVARGYNNFRINGGQVHRALVKKECGRLNVSLTDFNKFPTWLLIYFGESNVEKYEHFLRYPSFSFS
jgi:hypothetical protein